MSRDLHPIEAPLPHRGGGDCRREAEADLLLSAALGVAALALALRPLLVAVVALVLTLAGYRPRRTYTPRPVVARVTPLTVERLRWLVRRQHGSAARPGGRRIAQARKADLLAALYAEVVA